MRHGFSGFAPQSPPGLKGKTNRARMREFLREFISSATEGPFASIILADGGILFFNSRSARRSIIFGS
jgi:hypothetical protein